MKVLREDCHCIYKHKPSIDKYSLGSRWVCPDCGCIWIRVNNMHRFHDGVERMMTWEHHGEYEKKINEST